MLSSQKLQALAYIHMFTKIDKCSINPRGKSSILTFVAQFDSSKLERKPWVRNGFNSPGPEVSRLQAFHSSGEISEIDETTQTDSFLALSKLVPSPYYRSKKRKKSVNISIMIY